tara:strand:+ start:549 stop:728 length:180 start_codon:yes stop_codon:yes gene_type:complete
MRVVVVLQETPPKVQVVRVAVVGQHYTTTAKAALRTLVAAVEGRNNRDCCWESLAVQAL